MSPTAFRCMVLASLVLWASSAVVDVLVPSLIPPSISQAVENEPLPAVMEQWWFAAVIVPWVLALLAGVFGLLLFKRWARTLSLWLTLFGFCLYPFLGSSVWSGWATGFNEAASTVWGAALAVAFFSPLAERFARKQ